MQLIICEKPRVASKVAYAIGEGSAEQRHAGQVSYYVIKKEGKEIVVAPTTGHIFTLKPQNGKSSYPVFDVEWVPSYTEKGSEFTKPYLDNLRALGKHATETINACDYDIEGSLIGYNIIRFLCSKTAKQMRMKFSTLTPNELLEAYQNRSALDLPNAKAGEARHYLDWFYGINLSRALMSAIRGAGTYKILSIGRVQGPALEILSKREKEILAFKSLPFWQIFAFCSGVRFTHIKDRFTEKKDAEQVLANSSKSGTVDSVESKERVLPPLPPFNLTALQIDAYRYLGFSPTETLALAQTLYESSLISYPRTSSQQLSEKLNLPKIITALAKNPCYLKLAGELIGKKRFKPHNGEKTDPAHPAIHPTGILAKTGPRETKLYDLIVRRFLACFAESAKREQQTVILVLGSERYKASGGRTTKEGWFAFYSPYISFEEQVLPHFEKGKHVLVDDISIKEGKTQPPKRYTPASVIQLLEKKNLGTKATRAGIIETLFKRGYLTGTQIRVSELGLAVARSLEKNCPEILDEKLTRNFEDEMERIQEGKTEAEKVIQEGKNVLTKTLAHFKQRESEIGKELALARVKTEGNKRLLGACVACKGELRIIYSAAGKQFVGCSGYPNCRSIYPLPQKAKITPLNKTCEHCGTPRILVHRGKTQFEMCLDTKCKTKENWAKKKQSP